MEQRMVICDGCGEEKPHRAKGLCGSCYAEVGGKTRAMEGASGKVKRDTDTGRPMCRWCQKPVPKRKRTFCSEECIHEWRVRTSPQYVRMKVFERDGGICAKCGISSPQLEAALAKLFRTQHDTWQIMWQVMLNHGYSKNRQIGLWDADHIQAVTEGGGLCGLDNFRTLCIPCHKDETKKLHKRMAEARRNGIDVSLVPHGTAWESDEIESSKRRRDTIIAAIGVERYTNAMID